MFIFTADWHLTNNPKDDYRWKFIGWLKAQLKSWDGNLILFILGDITASKDYHSGALLNRIIGELRELATLAKVFIVMGNHDYVDFTLPYFKFLTNLGIHFVSEPVTTTISNMQFCLLPHTKEREFTIPKDCDFVLFHQLLSGALLENKTIAEGMPIKSLLKSKAYCIGGDIHTPQQLGKKIFYVGAPYPIDFGDSYAPRILLYDSALRSVEVPSIAKLTVPITDLDQIPYIKYRPGDFIRVVINLRKSGFYNWLQYKKAVLDYFRDKKVSVTVELQPVAEVARAATKIKGLTKQNLFQSYCAEHEIKDARLIDIAREIMEAP